MPFLRSFLATILVTSLAAADELRTLDNRTIIGTVVSIDDKEVTFKVTDDIIKTPLDNVIALDLRKVTGIPAGTSYTDVRLVDDTALVCSKYAIKGKEFEATLLGGQTVKMPLANVASILRGAEDVKLRQAWDGLLANKIKRDRVVLYKGGAVNDLEGTIGDADKEGNKIHFTADGASIDVPIGNLQGMIFYRPEGSAAASPICMVYDTAGNALAATKVNSQNGKVTIVSTVPNVNFQLDASKVARFDYNMGKLTFLSDMTPTKVVEKSAVGLLVAHRKDVNLDGEPIMLDRSYPKGLSLHAHTELEYDLKGKYKKFTAVLGVDPRVSADSQARVTIEIDGRAVFSDVVTSRAVVPVDINVTRAGKLRIIVSSRNFLDLHDQVTIANPKITQ